MISKNSSLRKRGEVVDGLSLDQAYHIIFETLKVDPARVDEEKKRIQGKVQSVMRDGGCAKWRVKNTSTNGTRELTMTNIRSNGPGVPMMQGVTFAIALDETSKRLNKATQKVVKSPSLRITWL